MPLSSKEGLTMRIRYMLISSACRLALERIIPRFYGATRLSDSPTLENLDFPQPCSTTSCQLLALETSLESLKLSLSTMFVFEPLLFNER